MGKQVEIKERESKTDIAYRLMLKKKKAGGRNFYELWDAIKAELAKVVTDDEMANIENDISFFYTSLTLDGRFVNVGDNKWELRERVTFDQIQNIIDESESEDDEDEVISEENEDNKNNEYSNEDNFDEKYDDSTGSDADIDIIREHKEQEEEEF